MFWYNGSIIESNTLELPSDDPGLLYGATVFTTLRVYNGSLDNPLTNWAAHCARLRFSLETFHWRFPNWQQLRQGAELIAAKWPVLRIAIFYDGRELISGRNLPADLTKRQQNGIKAWLAEAPHLQRSLPVHKTGNYLSAWLALQSAQQQGALEAILVDAAGNWLETSTGNLWGWRSGQWFSPPLDGRILPGLTRAQLFSWLEKQGHSVREQPWTPELVQEFEALAYSNCVAEVIPIHTVVSRHRTFTYNPNHIAFQQLQSLFQSSQS